MAAWQRRVTLSDIYVAHEIALAWRELSRALTRSGLRERLYLLRIDRRPMGVDLARSGREAEARLRRWCGSDDVHAILLHAAPYSDLVQVMRFLCVDGKRPRAWRTVHQPAAKLPSASPEPP